MRPIARKDKLVVQQSGDETLVYKLESDYAICLNETSAAIWDNCDGKKSLADIQLAVETRFGELVTEDLIKLGIDVLKREGLLANEEEVVTNFEGVGRREAIRKIGFGSMIAIPLVSAIVAPPAVDAQSGCPTVPDAFCGPGTNLPNGCLCSHFTPQCCSGNCVGTGPNSFCRA